MFAALLGFEADQLFGQGFATAAGALAFAWKCSIYMIDSAGLYPRASAPLLATPLLQPEIDPPKEGQGGLETAVEASPNTELSMDHELSAVVSTASSDDYAQLQRRYILATLTVSAFAVAVTALFFDLHIASSLLVGALSGVLYLRLLARSVGKLGNGSKSVSKFQLLVPVLLVLAVSRLPQLELLPALLGFLLYKPAMILQVLLES